MKLNEKLAELRRAKGLTQQEVAEALDVSRQAISRWEVGATEPSLDNLAFLSRLYGVPLDEFVQKGTGEPAKIPEEISIDVPLDVSVGAPAAALPRAGRSYATPVCAFLAVLILGVGILIGVSVQLKLESGDQSVSNTTGENGASDFYAAYDQVTISMPEGSYTYNVPSKKAPAELEKRFLSEEDLQKIEEQITARQEDTRKNAPPRTKLSDEDARELAEQYNPTAMTREQYDGILETLADKGVLTREEISYMGYRGITVVDFTTIREPLIIPLNDPMDQASRDLLWSQYSTGGPYGGTRFNNANGTYDVLAWADMMNTYRNIDTESWQGYHGALYDALDQVKSARESAK